MRKRPILWALLVLALLGVAAILAILFIPRAPAPVPEQPAVADQLVIPDDLEQAIQPVDDGATVRAQAIIDLPGDPVLVTRKQDASLFSAKVRLPQTLGQAEPPAEMPVFLFSTSLLPSGSELSDSLHALSESVATAVPVEQASDTGGDDDAAPADFVSGDAGAASDEEAAAAIAQQSDFQALDLTSDASEQEVRQGTGQPLILETTTLISASTELRDALVRDGFTLASADSVEDAAQRLLNRKTLAPGTTLIARGARGTSGDYRAMQVSLYEQREYVGTIAWADSGGYDLGAEPDLPPDAFDNQPKIVAPRRYTLSDGLVAAGIRNAMPEATVREATALLGKVTDLTQAVAADDIVTVMYSREPRDTDKGTGRVFYIGAKVGAKTVQCFVFRTRTSPFQCISESGVIDGSGVFQPVQNANISSTFGMRVHPILGIKKLHAGVDWAAPIGTPVMAIATGRINFVGTLNGFGNHIRITHGSGPDSDPGGGDVVESFVISGILAESGNNPNAQNPLSSAGGLGQFIDSTWIAIVKKHAPEVAKGKSDEDLLAIKKGTATADLQLRMTKAYAQDNANILKASGVEVTQPSLYAAHFLGPDLAVRVLRSDDTVSMTKFMSEKAITANPRQASMNVGDFRQWLALKMGRSTKGYETSYSHLDHFASGLKVGQTVSRGDVIGFIGTTGLSTGPHLHFQYYLKGVPVDPLLYMQRQTVTLTAAEKSSFAGSRSELVAALTSAGFSPVGQDDSSAAQQR